MHMILKESDYSGENKHNENCDNYKYFKDCYEFAFRTWSPFLNEANKDLAFYLGDQWEPRERDFLESQKRSALVFNRIRRNIKMLTGYERRTRHSIIANPVENSDELAASNLTSVLLWLWNQQSFGNISSDAFEACLKTGINLLELSMDYSEDPIDGDITLTRVPYNAFLLDPRFQKRDLSDCEYIIKRKILSKNKIKTLLPFRAEEIEEINGKGPDGKFPLYDGSMLMNNSNTLKYDEFWTRETKSQKVLIDKQTGDQRVLDKKEIDMERLNFIIQNEPTIEVIDKEVPVVRLNIYVEGINMFNGLDPWKINDFPQTPVMAFWDPEYSSNDSNIDNDTPGSSDYGDYFRRNSGADFSLKLQSLVRCSRDPQTESNKRRSKMLDMLDSQLNSGWIAKEGSVSNKNSLYRSGQGEVVWATQNSQPGDISKIPPADLPPGIFQLSQMMDSDIVEIAGITDELLGMQEDGNLQMSGVLAKLRQGAGLTVLQDVFDNYRYSMKMVGKKAAKIIQNNWSPQKIERIIGEEVSQEFYSKNFGKYDISVEESMETPTQRALVYAQLMQAKQAGIAIPDSLIIDYLPLQEKDKLRKALEEQEQQAKVVQEEQLEDQARLRELQRAKVFSDLGLGVERMARAEADRGLARERISELQENHSNAMLDRIRAIKEIQEMDENRLIRFINLFETLEQQNKAQAEQVQQQQQERSQEQLSASLGFIRDKSAQQPGVQTEGQF